MANTETTTSRKGGSNFIPLAVALVAVAVFLGWLATRPVEEAVAVAEPEAADTGAVDEPTGPAESVEAGDLSGATGEQFVGRTVQLSAEVLAGLGARLFWIDAGGQPFLVHIEQGAPPPSGQRVQLTGTVREKTDALLDEWEQTGVLESADHRLQASYGTTYIDARRVQPAAG